MEDIFLSRPTVIKVSKEALRHNITALITHAAPAKVMAVVKSNGYGHGMVECAKTFLAAGAHHLGVAILEEGIALRRSGITAPIHVFGGILGDQIEQFLRHDLELTASSIGKLEAINTVAAKIGIRAKIHLKIDTGMERIGVHHYSALPFLERALTMQHCEIVGVFSHFATADEADFSGAKLQLEYFLQCSEQLCSRAPNKVIRHIANSAATLRMPESHLDLVRPGSALYGIPPAPDFDLTVSRVTLSPAMSLISRVVYFKVVRAGSGISYGHTYKPPRDTRIVTVAIGYGDGYTRRLSNKAEVLIRGKRFPIRGNICMDQLMVEIGNEEAYNGDEVVLLGKQGDNEITADELALRSGTISYEIITVLGGRIPRVYVD